MHPADTAWLARQLAPGRPGVAVVASWRLPCKLTGRSSLRGRFRAVRIARLTDRSVGLAVETPLPTRLFHPGIVGMFQRCGLARPALKGRKILLLVLRGPCLDRNQRARLQAARVASPGVSLSARRRRPRGPAGGAWDWCAAAPRSPCGSREACPRGTADPPGDAPRRPCPLEGEGHPPLPRGSGPAGPPYSRSCNSPSSTSGSKGHARPTSLARRSTLLTAPADNPQERAISLCERPHSWRNLSISRLESIANPRIGHHELLSGKEFAPCATGRDAPVPVP